MMKHHQSTKARQSGFSLVEMMIAGSLGLIVLLSITNIFVASQKTNNLARAISDIQQDARFGTEIITRSARRAGHYPTVVSIDGASYSSTYTYVLPTNYMTGLVTVPPVVTRGADFSTEGVGTAADQLALASYFGAGGRSDCSGSTQTSKIMIEVFDITGTTFRCQPFEVTISSLGTITTTTTGTATSLLNGVSNFQVEYGIDQSTDFSVNYWTHASSIPNTSSVVAVRFWLTVDDEVQGLDPLSAKTFVTTRYFQGR